MWRKPHIHGALAIHSRGEHHESSEDRPTEGKCDCICPRLVYTRIRLSDGYLCRCASRLHDIHATGQCHLDLSMFCRSFIHQLSTDGIDGKARWSSLVSNLQTSVSSAHLQASRDRCSLHGCRKIIGLDVVEEIVPSIGIVVQVGGTYGHVYGNVERRSAAKTIVIAIPRPQALRWGGRLRPNGL